MDFKKIAEHYLKTIITSDDYNTGSPCNNIDLLYPEFKDIILTGLTEYEEVNSDNDVPYIYETFRSHAMQSVYYFRGASKIKGGNILNAGMHHLGVGVDIINLKDENGNRVKDRGEAVDWENIDYVTLRKIMRKHMVFDLGTYEVCHFQAIPSDMQQELRRVVHHAVLEFQSENGLKADGIVGVKTIQMAREVFLPQE